MENISILDCTLRDGGYVNDWAFGQNETERIVRYLCQTNVDILEVGFLRDEPYDRDRVVFNSMRLVQTLKEKCAWNRKVKLAVMAEIAHPIPLHMIEPAEMNGIDIIRVIVWKSKYINGKVTDALDESYAYCRGIAEKGYKLCIQPNRTDQYSEAEFSKMVEKFSDLSPMAIYVVDSWGTMYSDQVIRYMDLADRLLGKEIAIGFHGHNNLMQAFSTAEKIITRRYGRNIILDASVYGIGRGAGNLNLELIARYLNEEHGADYRIEPMLEVYDRCLSALYSQRRWGSSMPYALSASFGANPNYASYYENKLSAIQIKHALQSMSGEDKVLFTEKIAQKYQRELYGYQGD